MQNLLFATCQSKANAHLSRCLTGPRTWRRNNTNRRQLHRQHTLGPYTPLKEGAQMHPVFTQTSILIASSSGAIAISEQMMDRYEFAILGAGALGSIIGAHLSRSGRSVVMLARGQRALDIEREGLRIKGLTDFNQRVPVLTDPSKFEGAEVFIVATKTHNGKAALSPYSRAKVGSALSVQNGVMKDDDLVGLWGRERVLGALADTSGELLAGGEVLFTRNEQIYIGEFPGDGVGRARAQRISSVIDRSGIRASAVPNIESLEWSKFVAWVGMMALAVITREVTWKYMMDPGLAVVLARLVREMGILAVARGITLSNQSPLPVATIIRASESQAAATIQACGREIHIKAPQHRMSSLQDLEAGRALEVEETLGYAVRNAERLGLSLPTLVSFYSIVAGIDRIRHANAS
ncbi:MAG: 2-dehydropantoate 2-reductase [Gammaproteobacteria bacterium]